MDHGLKVESGDKLGKTIIFAKNSLHAKVIVDRFHVLFPEYGDSFIKQIDYSIKYVDTLIDDFSTFPTREIAVGHIMATLIENINSRQTTIDSLIHEQHKE